MVDDNSLLIAHCLQAYLHSYNQLATKTLVDTSSRRCQANIDANRNQRAANNFPVARKLMVLNVIVAHL